MKHQLDDLPAWIALYKESGKLPQIKVGCCTCKTNFTTLFGDNLAKRVTVFGSIENLLTKFTCRDCRVSDPTKAKKVAPKAPKKPRVKKSNTRDSVHDALMMSVSTGTITHKYNPQTIDLVKNKTECAEVTKDTCYRPDIYLNNRVGNRGEGACDGCTLFENCACSFKKLRK